MAAQERWTTTANVSVVPAEACRPGARVGLLDGRTGVPLVLLFLREVDAPTAVELGSAGDVEARLRASTDPEDRQAWQGLLGFFEAEGTKLVVHLSPRGPDAFESLVGQDRGLQRRTGLHAVSGYREVADLLVVPQASRWLADEAHRRFHARAFTQLAADPHFFFLAELPLAATADEATSWLDGVVCPDAALFYPWLCRDQVPVAPAVVAAAVLQRSDRRFGPHRLPSNQPINGGFVPMRRHSPAELGALVDRRVTVFHRFSGRETCLWGGATLAAAGDDDSRFLSTRRTLLALREAVHRVCEPFVLEPLAPGIEKAVDVALESAFEPLRKFFASATKQAFATEVRVERHCGEDVLVIDVQCALPYVLGEVSFRLGVAA
jgi:hypothetical protein